MRPFAAFSYIKELCTASGALMSEFLTESRLILHLPPSSAGDRVVYRRVKRYERVGALALRGLTQPVVAHNVPLVATQPAFRAIEGGPQSV